MATWPARGQQAPDFWDGQLKEYIDTTPGVGFNARTLGAVGDGVVNDRAAVQATIDAASAAALAFGGMVAAVLPAGGTYRLGSSLIPKSGVILYSAGARITTSFTGSAIYGGDLNCTDFEVDGIEFRGTVNEFPTTPKRGRTTSGAGLECAISLNGDLNPSGGGIGRLTNFVMRNCKVRNTSGLPILIRGVRGTIRVINNEFTNCMDVGFTFNEEVIFSNNHVQQSADNGVSLSRGNVKITCTGNTFDNCAYHGIWAAGFLTDLAPTLFTVTGNVVRNVGKAGIWASMAPKHGVIADNVLDGGFFHGPSDEPSDGACAGIVLAGYPEDNRPVPTSWAENIMTQGNAIRRFSRAGVLLIGVRHVSVLGNLVTDIGTQFLADGVTAVSAADQGQNVGILMDYPTTSSDVVIALNHCVDTRTVPYMNWAIVPVGSVVADQYLNTMKNCRNAFNLVETGSQRNINYTSIHQSSDRFTAGAIAGASAATGTVAGFDINGAATSNRMHQILTASVIRWRFGCEGTAESSTATGSNWEIRRHNNAGAYMDTPLAIKRELGQVQILTYPVQVFSATTANRPTPAAAGVGAHMFDTTLGKPIWSNGANWKDATGTNV